MSGNYVNEIATEPAPARRPLVLRRPVMRGPLTFQQLFLWDYFDLKSGERPRGTCVFQIVGSLDSDLVERSLNEVVRHYDCLRTRIVITDGTLEQHVDARVEFGLEVVDVAGLAQKDRETQARAFIHEFAMRKCDLAVDPPVAAALIKMSTQEHLLAWSIHHALADGISSGLALAEFWFTYSELARGRQSHLARAPVRYLDYALWQHATHNDWLQKHGDYWQERMASGTRVQWPTDTCAARDEPANASIEVDFSPIRLADLRKVARCARTTPAMVMLTVYAAVLASWCRQNVFAIPVNVAGRDRPEHQHAVGYFAQFLYVVIEITSDETYFELLAKVSSAFRGALLHQDFGRIATQAPDILLGSMFSWAPWKLDTFGLPASSMANELGLSVQRFEFTQPMHRLDFQGIGALFCEADGEYSGTLWFSTDAFSTCTVERFATELRSLCQRVVADPHCLLVAGRRKRHAWCMNDISVERASTGIPLSGRGRGTVRGPLTFQQLFLWDYFNLKNGEHRRDTFVFRIVGSLDSELLARSLSEVVRRHDSLRTRIVMMDGILEQHVDEPVEFDVEGIDLAKFDQNDRETHARDFIHEFARRKCDLDIEPPMIAALIQMSADEHLLAWAIHHLVTDGVSNLIVLGEIWSVYGDLLLGRQPHLTHTPVRYLDYALWQHATHSDWLLKHERYWQDRIAGAARARWPSDTRVAKDERANAWFEMSGMPPLADLRKVARNAQTTPAMVMLTVYAAVVARWCEQRALTIPVNVAGRHRPEHEHAAGYFAQFLYVNVEVSCNETFIELLARVSGEFRAALTHQDFGKVAAQVPEVLLGSAFSWLPWKPEGIGVPPSSILNGASIAVQQFPFSRPPMPTLQFQGIACIFTEAQGEYSGALWYRTDAFSTPTVERFASELRSWCERVVTSPHCLLADKCSA